MAYDPIQPVQEITPPLALRDSGDRDRFNQAAESNLTDMAQLARDLNADAIPKINAASEQVNEILPVLPEVVAVGQNAASIATVAGHIANVDAVADNMADIDAVAAVAPQVATVGGNIAAVNTAAANMDAILAAPGAASAAAASATDADQSAQAAAGSATAADARAQDAAESALAAAQSETNAAGSAAIALGAQQAVAHMEEHVAQMHDSLVEGASPEALPETPILRDTNARAQIADPAEPLDIVNKQSMDTAINTAVSSLAGGLKTPVPLDKESDLPDIATAQTGDYYVVADMDVTAPGYQGRVWCNLEVSATEWQTVVDRVQSPDGTSVVFDSAGSLAVAEDIRTAAAYVDTGGSVSAAIADAVSGVGTPYEIFDLRETGVFGLELQRRVFDVGLDTGNVGVANNSPTVTTRSSLFSAKASYNNGVTGAVGASMYASLSKRGDSLASGYLSGNTNLMYSRNNGSSWQTVSIPGHNPGSLGSSIVNILDLGNNVGILSNKDAATQIWTCTTDVGAWTARTGLPSRPYSVAAGGDYAYAVSGLNTGYRWDAAGNRLDLTFPGVVGAIKASPSLVVAASSASTSTVCVSIDNGYTWQTRDLPWAISGVSIQVSSNIIAIDGIAKGSFGYSFDFGQTWSVGMCGNLLSTMYLFPASKESRIFPFFVETSVGSNVYGCGAIRFV